MPQRNAEERVHLRLKEWADRTGHGAATILARKVSGRYGEAMSVQWASGVINGKPLRLKHLDAVAELLDTPPGDLVRRDDDHYLEVIPSEFRFITHIRKLPDTVRQHLLHVYDYMFSIHDKTLREQKATVDRRTKAARLERERQRVKDLSRPKNPSVSA